MLYNEERPAKLSEMIGQGQNLEIFRKQISDGYFSHAYLFAGHHGSGKTTSARILAKAAVCENPTEDGACCECESCRRFETSADVVEIDAASNTGVDAIRSQVVDAVRFQPVDLSKKIIIIDEVHMLSTSAFNALLKTIEEPPKYTILFLCTTELNKVPKTIVSRCQKFTFSGIPMDEIKGRLLEVAGRHNISIDEEAAYYIAKVADGSMRDALSILDQLAVNDVIDKKVVLETVGIGDMERVDNIIDCVMSSNYSDMFNSIDAFLSSSSVVSLKDAMLERIIERIADGSIDGRTSVAIINAVNTVKSTVAGIKTALYSVSCKNNEIDELKARVAELEVIVKNGQVVVKEANVEDDKVVEEVEEFEEVENAAEVNVQDMGFSVVGDVSDMPFEQPEETMVSEEMEVVENMDEDEEEIQQETIVDEQSDSSDEDAFSDFTDFGNPWGW